MNKIYDLYGLTMSSLDEARSAVERALNIKLEPHESGYLGGNYFRYNNPGMENFILQPNYIASEQELNEPEYPDAVFLLYVNETQSSEDLRSALEKEKGIRLLRHRSL